METSNKSQTESIGTSVLEKESKEDNLEIQLSEAEEKLLDSAANGDKAAVKEALSEGARVYVHRKDGKTPLILAAIAENLETVSLLLEAGSPWNSLDASGKCAGDYAFEANNEMLIDKLINQGVMAELLLYATSRNAKEFEKDEKICGMKRKNDWGDDKYLEGNVKYDEEKLVDDEGRGVMMDWEKPLMELHASVLCKERGIDISILNIGFGMGIVDTEIQKYKVKSHTIVEAHPAVYQKMLKDGWDKKEGVKIVFGKWQDVVSKLETYDGIFFDTFGEHYDDMRIFHKHLPKLLNEDGIYSFFNGMCPHNFFFHAVACEVARLELMELGLDVEFKTCKIDVDEKVWEEVKLRYWYWKSYNLPICKKQSGLVFL